MPPIQGLKLLDLSRQLPGPFASMMLADLGVDVLVITAPNDPMGIGLPLVQRNKRSMTLNLKTPAGQDVFRRLAADADIILEGFRPGVTARLGIDYATMAALNPRLVYCSISGYGQDGPYRDKVGHDLNYLGYAGLTGVHGAADGPPLPAATQIADIGGGAQMAVIGILAALMARAHTGRGQFVDIAMMDGAISWNVYHLMMHLISGEQPPRGKTRLTGHHPCYAIYETKDGQYVTVGALEEHFWKNLCVALGVEEFIPDQFAEGARREEMFAVLRAQFRSKTRAEWLRELDPIDVCFGPVNDIADVFDDPQVKHRGTLPVIDGQRTIASPIRLSATPARPPQRPPTTGEHTAGVLQELGFDARDVERFRAEHVI